MTKFDLENIINYIVNQGIKSVRENTDENALLLDYMGIFVKDDAEFVLINDLLKTLGTPGDKTATSTGVTYLLNEPIETSAGTLKVLKIRKPDPTRPQRGAPDFRVGDYLKFKKKYLSNGHNFSLIIRPEYEMMELKGIDVLVYFPSRSFDDRQGI